MRKFTAGLIAGGVIGAVGLGYAMSDRRVRKRVKRGSRIAMNKASDAIESIADVF